MRRQPPDHSLRLLLLRSAHPPPRRLQSELDDLEQELGVTIIQFDVHGLINDVIANPSDYGFFDVETPSFVFGADPPAGFLFFDDVHPTTQGHAILAEGAWYVIENALAP